MADSPRESCHCSQPTSAPMPSTSPANQGQAVLAPPLLQFFDLLLIRLFQFHRGVFLLGWGRRARGAQRL